MPGATPSNETHSVEPPHHAREGHPQASVRSAIAAAKRRKQKIFLFFKSISSSL